MASAASVTANSTNSSGTLLNNHDQQNNNGLARTTMRTTSNARTVDAGRKQSPVDGVSRRPSAQKAWGSSSTSIPQWGPVSVQQNGNPFQARSSNSARSAISKEAGISDKQAHERLMYLFGAAIGLNVAITVKAGDRFEGLLSGSTLNPTNSKITLKMVRKLHAAAGEGQTNGTAPREAALVGSGPEHALNLDVKDIADMVISEFAPLENSKLANGTPSGFQTDADISGNQTRGERTLQKWVPEGPDTADLSLDSGNTGTWDQFSVNSQLFGAQSTYDETLYTTVIDRNAPSYKRREAEAERIAREIEAAASANPHVREERGQALENDGDDEEEKYSGVRREESALPSLPVGGPNKYTPPARRAPTAQATVAGAPVDPAIISAQLSAPEPSKSNIRKATPAKEGASATDESAAPPADKAAADRVGSASAQLTTTAASEAPTSMAKSSTTADAPELEVNSADKLGSQGPTENVEVKVLNHFRQFAEDERKKFKKAQANQKALASQDRTTKLNDLLRFSKTFKLKTPIPNDLIGILAKDPAKQEAIIEKAQKEHAESASAAASPTPAPVTNNAARKHDVPQPPPAAPDRQVFNRGRGGFPQPGRSDGPGSQQQAPVFPARNNHTGFQPRFGTHQQDRKGTQPHSVPPPIPIIDGRLPPTGPMADQSGLTSPQRSNMHTPTSGNSAKFNLNVKASEFRPTAATFNPGAPSLTPSSPGSTHRGSISRAGSPSLVFGHRKPKPASERPSIADFFNPIKRMKEEFAPKPAHGAAKTEEIHKDYSANGGIPYAFQTGPRWTVKADNDQKTYEEAFEQHIMPVVSPAQSRAGSTHQVPYPGQAPVIPNAPANLAQTAVPQHGMHAVPQQYTHQYEDGSHRMQFGAANLGVYPSPSIPSRQASTYASPMTHPAQLAYQQQPYFGAPTGQMPMQVRPFAGTPGMMHAQVGQVGAPMMVQQPSNGPYMAVPQQFNHQMPMYSPNPGHVYPQQNGGYSSPGRVAPMMMQQGSQQGHHAAPNMMFSMSNQGGPLVYPQQQMGLPRGGYGGGHQYGSTPHQGYTMQHRTMSTGYGQIPQKMHAPMQPSHGPAMNGPPQGPAYPPLEAGPEDGK